MVPIGTNRLNIVGFETGEFSECYFVDSNNGPDNDVIPSITSVDSRSGEYGLHIYGPGGGVGIAGFNDDGTSSAIDKNTIFVRFYFRIDNYPSSSSEFFAIHDPSKICISLRIDSSGNVMLYGKTPSQSIRGTNLGTITTLDLGIWTMFEVRYSRNGSYRVGVDGDLILAGRQGGTASSLEYILLGNSDDRVAIRDTDIDMWFDDVSLDVSGFPGSAKILATFPAGDGFYSDWTGSYADANSAIDEDYISGGAGLYSSFTVENTTDRGIGAPIYAVKVVAFGGSDTGDEAKLSNLLRLESIDYTSNETDTLPEGNVSVSKVYNKNPVTSDDWQYSEIDNAEIGVISSADTTGAICNYVGLMVECSGLQLRRRTKDIKFL